MLVSPDGFGPHTGWLMVPKVALVAVAAAGAVVTVAPLTWGVGARIGSRPRPASASAVSSTTVEPATRAWRPSARGRFMQTESDPLP